MARAGMRWEHWAIVILIGVLVFFWVTWPKPKPDERILEYEQVIRDQQDVIDSLQSVLKSENAELIRLKERTEIIREDFNEIIARQKKQLKSNEKIHTLPTPELDSIVRALYGEGAI